MVDAPKSKHVVFIGVDGVQLRDPVDAQAGYTSNKSNLTDLNKKGLVDGIMKLDVVEARTGGMGGFEDTTDKTYQSTNSGPGWTTLLTGVWKNEHGINTTAAGQVVNPEVKTLFQRINEGVQDAVLASLVHGANINTSYFKVDMGKAKDSSGKVIPGIVDYTADHLPDQGVVADAKALIAKEAPTFMFMHLARTDNIGDLLSAGKVFVEEGKKYEDALIEAAKQVNEILTSVAERMSEHPDEEWMVIVATDHGRSPPGYDYNDNLINVGTHAYPSDSERRTFIASNLELKASSEPTPQTSNVATILDFLGLSQGGLAAGAESLLDKTSPDTRKPYLLTAKFGDAVFDDALDVPVNATMKLVMSEAVKKGSGYITIHRASDNATFEAIDVASSLVTVKGGVVTFTPTQNLVAGVEYYVTVDATAFTDVVKEGQAPNNMEAISSPSTINFRALNPSKVADTIAPHLVSVSPGADGGDSKLTLTFDEAVKAGSGNIIIHNADGSIFATVPVTSQAVSFLNKTATISLSKDLVAGAHYSVEIEAGAIRDLSVETGYVTRYSENFDELASSLKAYTSSSVSQYSDGADWTDAPPAGWSVDNTGVKQGSSSSKEFKGWTFQDKSSWSKIPAYDVNAFLTDGRSSFEKGTDVFVVADSRMFNGAPNTSGGVRSYTNMTYQTLLKTSAIDVSGLVGNKATLQFDSSWGGDDSYAQEALVTITYNTGATQTLLKYDTKKSASNPNYYSEGVNDTVKLTLDIPDGASSAVISFQMNANVSWWWAIDNITVRGQVTVSSNEIAGISGDNAAGFDTAPAANKSHANSDLNGDHHSDIVLQNAANGAVYVLQMGGDDDGLGIKAQGSVGAPSGPGASWQVRCTGDFDGDGRSDILWQDPTTGAVSVWKMGSDGLSKTEGSIGAPSGPGPQWQVKGTGDFDGDGVSDILWQNAKTGAVYVWQMTDDGLGIKAQGSVGGSVGPGVQWQVKGTGDFDGDGRSDILWQNSSTSAVYVWQIDSNGLGIKAQGTVGADGGPGGDWQVKGTGDFDGDGVSDILWQNARTGDVYVWDIADDGLGIKAQGLIVGTQPGASTDWHATV